MAVDLVSCPSCGRKNATHRSGCHSCGAALRGKEFETEPKTLARALVAQVAQHWEELAKQYGQYFRLDSLKEVRIFSELVSFYYALFSLVVLLKMPNQADSGQYGELLLSECRNALIRANLPAPYTEWLLNDESFVASFYQGLSFYYHDEVSSGDSRDLARLMEIVRCRKEDTLLYLTAKLQLRLYKIFGLAPGDNLDAFLGLWVAQSKLITGIVSRLLDKIRPELGQMKSGVAELLEKVGLGER